MNIDDLTPAELDALIMEQKAAGKRYIECVGFLKETFGLGLQKAAEAALRSQAWSSQQEEILRNHEEAELEFWEAARESHARAFTTLQPLLAPMQLKIDESGVFFYVSAKRATD